MQPEELYFHGSMAEYWRIIASEYHRLTLKHRRIPFQVQGIRLDSSDLIEYQPSNSDEILIAFKDDEDKEVALSVDAEYSRHKQAVWIMAHDSGLEDQNITIALATWRQIKNALAAAGRLVDSMGFIVSTEISSDRSVDLDRKFDQYHFRKTGGQKYTLRQIAEETGYSQGYIRQLHSRYLARRKALSKKSYKRTNKN
jgi:hypothetical protein